MDPMVEQIIYGSLCGVAVLTASMVPRDWKYSLACAVTLTLYWGMNNFLWASDSMGFYALIDSVFALATMILYLCTRLRWLKYMVFAFLGNVVLDFLLIYEMIEYTPFAWASNGLFVLELFLPSVALFKRRQGKEEHDLSKYYAFRVPDVGRGRDA